jgi:hypothetical protein
MFFDDFLSNRLLRALVIVDDRVDAHLLIEFKPSLRIRALC